MQSEQLHLVLLQSGMGSSYNRDALGGDLYATVLAALRFEVCQSAPQPMASHPLGKAKECSGLVISVVCDSYTVYNYM